MLRTIHRTASLTLIAAALLPLIGAIVAVRMVTGRDMNQQLIESRSRLVEATAREADHVMRDAVEHLSIVRRLPSAVRTPSAAREELSALLKLHFAEVAVFDREGFLVDVIGPLRVTQEQSPWFRAAVERQDVVLSPPMLRDGTAEGGLSMRIYIPFPPGTPGDMAVVRASLPFAQVHEVLDQLETGPADTLILTDASGNLLYSRDPSKLLQKSGLIPLPGSDGLSRLASGGEEFIAASVPFRPSWQLNPERLWTLHWLEPADSFLRPAREANALLLKIAGVAAIGAAVAAWLIAQRLVRPVMTVAAAADRAARGDLDVSVPASRTWELAQLADSCNEMFRQLRENRSNLTQEVAERTAALSRVNDDLEVALAQLRQAQKMEAVGTMAGGISHDFNNLLTAINGNLQLALDQPGVAVGPAGDLLKRARAAGDRATGVVRSLLAFSRRNSVDLQTWDLRDLIDETRCLLRPTLDPRISLTVEPTHAPCTVTADAGQLGQVLMNLCINARDAIGERGQITLRAFQENIPVQEQTRAGTSRLSIRRPGCFVCLEVEDTGCGIPPENLARIFEPFFTTKAPNKGSGLGLAMCYGICQQHGGWIECRPGSGNRGTVFALYLPFVASGAPVNLRHTMRQQIATRPVLANNRTPAQIRILIADDEDTVRLVAEGVLRKRGYQVVSAVNGLEALEACRAGGIDLVILDGAMPIMSGHEAFAAIAREMPDLPVVVCTGNISAREEFTTPEGNVPTAFIEKPYSFATFLTAVETALKDAATRAAGNPGFVLTP